MLSVPRLRVLRELAARGSFSATAEALSFTQSAVSQQISALEREASTRLVERDRAGVRMTEAGQILLAHADAILGSLTEAERELRDYLELRSGRVRLAAFESAGATLLPPAIASFHQRYAEVELRVVQLEPEEAVARLLSRDLDLALVYDLEPSTGVLDEELELAPLFDDRYAMVLAAEHPLAGRRRVNLHDFAEDLWINTTGRDLSHRVLLDSCLASGFQPHVAFEVDEIAASQALVATEAAITILPQLALASRHPGVVVKSLGTDAPLRRVAVARLAKSYRAPATQAMLEILAETAPSGVRPARGAAPKEAGARG